jgi:ABC-type Fe3+/spermidine/putrescine transport system ATPase subunit
MNNAIIAQQGEPKDLYNNPKTSFVANFIGDANIVKAQIETRNENNYDNKE